MDNNHHHHLPKPTPSSGDRALLHRAIYDHFRRLSRDESTTKEVLLPPDEIPHVHNVAAEGPGTPPNLDAGQSALMVEKYQRVLTVLEQEFPEIFSLPAAAENVVEDTKPCSDLEFRYTNYPHVQQRLEESLEESQQHAALPEQQQQQQQQQHGVQMPPMGAIPPINMNPSVPAPCAPPLAQQPQPQIPMPQPHPPLIAQLPPLHHAPGMELPESLTFPTPVQVVDGPAAVPATATTTTTEVRPDTSNHHHQETNRKRKPEPTLLQEEQEQPSTKKLKEQETEIKKIKTQLKRAKDKIQQLSRTVQAADHTTNDDDTKKKEKAMAAAVPFDQRYQELVHFQRGHGHCRVPCTSKENPGLARWVQTLRAAYKEKQKRGPRYYGQLTDERQKRLDAIGFEWSIQAPKATWEQRFQELKAYKGENGHCRVVRSYAKNPSLGEWCHRQRFLAHKNQLEEYKVKQLTDLGFEIWVRKQGKSWEDHFEKLLDFRRKHQHLKVPPPDTRTKVKQVLNTASAGEANAAAAMEGTNQGDIINAVGAPMEESDSGPPNLDPATEEYKEEQAFRRWVVAQRDNYHLKYKKGIKSTLNNARVKKLDSIGFDWTREGGENDLRKIRRGELHHRNDPNIWKRRFAEVVEYKKRFGDCNIPKEWPENKQLGAWVSTQRKMCKALLAGERSSLTPERRSALESIGFTWILRPARTRPKILEIENLQRPAASRNNGVTHYFE